MYSTVVDKSTASYRNEIIFFNIQHFPFSASSCCQLSVDLYVAFRTLLWVSTQMFTTTRSFILISMSLSDVYDFCLNKFPFFKMYMLLWSSVQTHWCQQTTRSVAVWIIQEIVPVGKNSDRVGYKYCFHS